MTEHYRTVNGDVKISRWAIGIGLTISLFLLTQTAGLIVWGAGVTKTQGETTLLLKVVMEELKDLKSVVSGVNQKRYTIDDATADKNAQNVINRAFSDRVDAQGRRIDHLELQVGGSIKPQARSNQ